MALPRRSAIGVLLALSASAAWSATPAPSPESALKLSVATSAALPLGSAAQRWADRASASGGLLTLIQVHPGAALAHRDPARELIALRTGAADLAVGSALQWSADMPVLAVFAVPWIAPDDASLARLAAAPAVQGALADSLARSGVTLVAVAPLGHRILLTTAPVRSPLDLAGARIRTSALPLVQDLLVAFGALPYAGSLAAAPLDIARGVLQGQEGPVSSLATARTHALGPRNLVLWNAVGDAMIFVVRTPLWESLSSVQREGLREAARTAALEADAPAREIDAVRQLAREGVAVTRLTAAGRASFASIAAPVVARWKSVVGEEIVAKAEAAASLPPDAPGALVLPAPDANARD